MISWGMAERGIEIVRNTRRRYDGEKRNPWDEAECGHHYARAMSAWSTVLALSGFSYDGPSASVSALPPHFENEFRCLWATGTGWGTFSLNGGSGNTRFTLKVLSGTLACRSCQIASSGNTAAVRLANKTIDSRIERGDKTCKVIFPEIVRASVGDSIEVEVRT